MAVWVLAAHQPSQERVVGALARELGATSDLKAFLEWLDDAGWGTFGGLFAGPGWGREKLPAKLLPVTTVLIKRRVLPVKLLVKLLRLEQPSCPPPGVSPDELQEQLVEGAYERLREVLGEGWLAVALDAAQDAELGIMHAWRYWLGAAMTGNGYHQGEAR